MTIFEWLPEVEKCCFCISLKVGCIIIGIYYIVCCVCCSSYMPYANPCYARMDGKRCSIKPILKILNYVSDVMFIVVFVSAILFLVGIYMEKRLFITIFLYAITFSTLYYVCMLLILILASALTESCGFDKTVHTSCIISALIAALITFYFAVVVKSFRSSMEE